jgi:hypothetical protein
MPTWWSGQCGAFFNNNENSWQGFCGLLFWHRASTERAHWKNLAAPVGPRFNNKPLINEARVWIRGTDKKKHQSVRGRKSGASFVRFRLFLCQLLFKYTTGQIDCTSTYNATHGHFSTFAQSIQEDLQVSSSGIKNSLTEEPQKSARWDKFGLHKQQKRATSKKRGQNKNIKCLPWRWRWHFNIVASVEGVEK